MTSERSLQTPMEEPENGVLAETGAIDTSDLGILGTNTAHVAVVMPGGVDEDDLDDDVVDDDDISILFDALLTGDVSAVAAAREEAAENTDDDAAAEAERRAVEEAAEAERVAAEAAEAEREAAEAAEAERVAAEEAAAEAERVAAEEAAAEAEREAAEQAAAEEAKRVAAEEAAAEAERIAAEEAAEAERRAAEEAAAEAERIAAEEAAAEAERVAAEEAAAEAERVAAEEAAEAERVAAEQAAAEEAERVAAEEAAAEAERVAAQQAAAEAERVAAEQAAEAERVAAEQAAATELAAPSDDDLEDDADDDDLEDDEAEVSAEDADDDTDDEDLNDDEIDDEDDVEAELEDDEDEDDLELTLENIGLAVAREQDDDVEDVVEEDSPAEEILAGTDEETTVTTPAAGSPQPRRDIHDLERVATRPDNTLASKRLDDLGSASRETADLLTADRLLDPTQLVKPEPEGAWSHFLYTLSGKRINIGDGKRARERKELTAKIAAPIAGGSRFVPVMSRKGGVGKTTVTTLVGMALADARDDRIVAVDANPDRGTLAERIGKSTQKTVRDLVRVRDEIRGYNDLSSIVARDETRLDVLASDSDPRVSEAFSDEDYRHVAEVAGRYYSIVLTDTGTGIVHSVMGATLDLADQIIIVAGLSVDEARLASETLTWLETNGYADLARDAVVVLNQTGAGTPVVRLNEVEGHFRTRVRDVVRIPYDPMVASGSAITFRDLAPETRKAARQLASIVVSGLRSTPVA